jgi:hypothetical protein
LALASSAAAQSPLNSTVLVYDPGGKAAGAGVIVSPQGIVLTARHVVEDPGVEQQQASGWKHYHLRMEVQRYQHTDRNDARLIAVHPYLDIAVLQAEFDGNVPALRIASAGSLDSSRPVTLTGHRLGVDNQELFQQINGTISEADRNGIIVVRPNVPAGYSGGSTVQSGALYGVVRSVNPVRVETYVLPVAAFAPALRGMGVTLTEGSFARRTDPVQMETVDAELEELTRKMHRMEEFYAQSQTQVSWIARLVVKPGGAGNPPRLTLELTYEKYRDTQPDLVGDITADVEPLYDDDNYRDWRAAHPGEGRFRVSGLFDEVDRVVRKDGIRRELERLIRMYYDDLNLPLSKLRGFRIQSEITFVTADNSVTDPITRRICFALVPAAYESGPLKSMSQRGEPCLVTE